jgi:hypothetical protein
MAPPKLKMGQTAHDRRTGRTGEIISVGPHRITLRDPLGTFAANAAHIRFGRLREFRAGDTVEAREPTFGREWIRALLLDPIERTIEFLEHPVWRGAKIQNATIRRLSSDSQPDAFASRPDPRTVKPK